MAEVGTKLPRLSGVASDIRQSVFSALQGRIDAHRALGGELIALQIGDTHLDPPVLPRPLEMRELALYGSVAGLSELRAGLASFRRRRGLAAAESEETVHLGCGCTHALFCAARAVLDPGDEVIVVSPYWPLVTGLLQVVGARPIEVPWREPAAALARALEAALTPATRAIYFVSPNNPDGRVFDDATLEAIGGLASMHDLWVLADEVYADFVYDGGHHHLANRPGMSERTISCFSLSKSHALAGARIGYVVASPRVIAATRRMSNHTVYNVPVAMQRVALEALVSGEPWLEQARARYRATRDRTAAALDRLGLQYAPPGGGSFFFLDLAPLLGERPLVALLEKAIDAGVLLAPGEAFGRGFERFARLCFTGVPEEEVLEGVRRLGLALERFA